MDEAPIYLSDAARHFLDYVREGLTQKGKYFLLGSFGWNDSKKNNVTYRALRLVAGELVNAELIMVDGIRVDVTPRGWQATALAGLPVGKISPAAGMLLAFVYEKQGVWVSKEVRCATTDERRPLNIMNETVRRVMDELTESGLVEMRGVSFRVSELGALYVRECAER